MTDSVPMDAAIKVNGRSMRLRTLLYLLGAICGGFGGMASWEMLGVATTDDLAFVGEGLTIAGARLGALEPVVSEHAKSIPAIERKLNGIEKFLHVTVAESLADKAAAPIEDAKRSLDVWRLTRERVLDNLGADPPRPARDGIVFGITEER